MQSITEGQITLPERPDEFNVIVTAWKNRLLVEHEGEKVIIHPDGGKRTKIVLAGTGADWMRTIPQCSSKRTYLAIRIGDSQIQFVETSHLNEVLMRLCSIVEQKENIFRRCFEYREIEILCPTQIVKAGQC